MTPRKSRKYDIVYSQGAVRVEYVPRHESELVAHCEKLRDSVVTALRYLSHLHRHRSAKLEAASFILMQSLSNLEHQFEELTPQALVRCLANGSFWSEEAERYILDIQTTKSSAVNAVFTLRYGRSPRKKDMSFSYGKKKECADGQTEGIGESG